MSSHYSWAGPLNTCIVFFCSSWAGKRHWCPRIPPQYCHRIVPHRNNFHENIPLRNAAWPHGCSGCRADCSLARWVSLAWRRPGSEARLLATSCCCSCWMWRGWRKGQQMRWGRRAGSCIESNHPLPFFHETTYLLPTYYLLPTCLLPTTYRES